MYEYRPIVKEFPENRNCKTKEITKEKDFNKIRVTSVIA